MSKVYTMADVEKHTGADSAWVVVEGQVYDMTDFLDDHPGGKKILLMSCGKDSTEKFWKFHSKKVLQKTAAPYKIGTVAESAKL